MEKTFQFVDTSAKVDSTTRKLMRSHVMKGKNAGKTVNRRSRRELGAGRAPYDDTSFPEKEARMRSSEELGPVAKSLGSALRTFQFPVELSENALRSVNHFFIFITEKMYPSQLKLASDKYRYDWLMTTFIDKDASYCSLALIASTNEFFISGGVSSPKALSYLSNTLSLVKRRMQGDEALSDSTICMVMMLILQEQIRHENTSQIHYEGLKKMIKLRGGLSQLESCPSLLLKLSKMDILYTLRHGKPMFFFRDHMSEVRRTLSSMGLKFDPISMCQELQEGGINPYLRDILIDTMRIAALFNNPPTGQALELNTFLEIVISICCRLIRFRSLQSPKPESKKEAALHIGLITFMTTLFLQWDSRRIVEYNSISLRLTEVLHEEFDAQDSDLLLWLLLIGSLWFSPTSGHWITQKMRNLTVQLDIHNWPRVRDHICRFPWISALHDHTGSAVWNFVHQGSRIDLRTLK